jgi:hypothetical protein
MRHGAGGRPLVPLTASLPAPGDWIQTVGAVIADLQGVNQTSEAGFLAVGDELAKFLSMSRRISSQAGTIAELISGEQGQQQCDALKRLLDRIQLKENRTQSARTIPHVRQLADELSRCFAGFDGTAFAFKQVATAGRIEIGRLNVLATGLNQLTGEMRTCSEDIRSRVIHFLDTAELLDRRLNALLNGIAEFEQRESQAIPPLVTTVDRSLEGFQARRQRSETAVRELGVHFSDLSQAIGNVVLSMQSHDMTRQRIEHVIAALSQCTALSRRSPTSEAPQRSPSPEEAAVLALQLAQMEHVGETFAASVEALDRGLATIIERVTDMAAESSALVERSSNESDSFFDEMQRSFLAITEATGNCAAIQGDAHAALKDLAETIQRLVEALAEIVTVGSNLRLLALNTVIQARQLGPSGEPLRAVAGAVRELQLVCEERSREGSAILGKIGAAISTFGGVDEMGPVVQELGERIEELQASAARSAGASQEVVSLAAALRTDVQRAREDFAGGRSLADAVGRSSEALRPIVSAFRSTEVPLEASDWLADHAQNYTMQAQREIHERVIGQSDLQQAHDACGEVELF